MAVDPEFGEVPTEADDRLIATGLHWYVHYNPNLDGRDLGDEFDYPPQDHHWTCEIIIDEMETAAGSGATEEAAKAAALADFTRKIN